MAGISWLTLYEIANNDDVVAAFGGPDPRTGKFWGCITRGEAQNFKMLISTEPVYATYLDAVADMQEVIDWAKKFIREEIKK